MNTRITELLKIEHPIIQGAMSWVSFPPLGCRRIKCGRPWNPGGCLYVPRAVKGKHQRDQSPHR